MGGAREAATASLSLDGRKGEGEPHRPLPAARCGGGAASLARPPRENEEEEEEEEEEEDEEEEGTSAQGQK